MPFRDCSRGKDDSKRALAQAEPVYAEAAAKGRPKGSRNGGGNHPHKRDEKKHDGSRALAQAAKETGGRRVTAERPLSVREAARRADVPPATLRGWVTQGEIRVTERGKVLECEIPRIVERARWRPDRIDLPRSRHRPAPWRAEGAPADWRATALSALEAAIAAVPRDGSHLAPPVACEVIRSSIVLLDARSLVPGWARALEAAVEAIATPGALRLLGLDDDTEPAGAPRARRS